MSDELEHTEDDLPLYVQPGGTLRLAQTPCVFLEGHNFRFLRQRKSNSSDALDKDIFFCTKCLIKREVPA